MQTVQERGQTPGQLRNPLLRTGTPTRTVSENSGTETESEGYTKNVYTSGTLASDEEIGSISQCQGSETTPTNPVTELLTVAEGTR